MLLTKVLVLLNKGPTYQLVNLQVLLVSHILVYSLSFILCYKKGQHSLKQIINIFSFGAVCFLDHII